MSAFTWCFNRFQRDYSSSINWKTVCWNSINNCSQGCPENCARGKSPPVKVSVSLTVRVRIRVVGGNFFLGSIVLERFIGVPKKKLYWKFKECIGKYPWWSSVLEMLRTKTSNFIKTIFIAGDFPRNFAEELLFQDWTRAIFPTENDLFFDIRRDLLQLIFTAED